MLTLQGLFRLAVLPIIALLLVQQKAFPLINLPHLQPYVSWLPVSIQSVIVSNRPSVTFSQGTVVGSTIRDTLKNPVDAFRGIRYALPPVGDRRFRRAEPIGASDNIIDASRFGPR
jgi:triacylglycerol lipase